MEFCSYENENSIQKHTALNKVRNVMLKYDANIGHVHTAGGCRIHLFMCAIKSVKWRYIIVSKTHWSGEKSDDSHSK